MAGGTMLTRVMSAPRLLLGAAVLAVGILGAAPMAFASKHAGPQIVPHVASFSIPSRNTSRVVWTLNVWKQGDLIGSDTGTSGVLTVTLPRTTHGKLQADVRRNGRWYSGDRVNLPGTSGGGTGTGGGNGHGGGKGGGSHGGSGTSGGSPGTGTGGGTSGGGTTGTSGGPPGSGSGTTGTSGGLPGSGGASTAGGNGSAANRSGGTGSTSAGSSGRSGTVDPITLAVGKPPASALEVNGTK